MSRESILNEFSGKILSSGFDISPNRPEKNYNAKVHYLFEISNILMMLRNDEIHQIVIQSDSFSTESPAKMSYAAVFGKL